MIKSTGPPAEPRKRAPYLEPRLVVYGDVAVLTQKKAKSKHSGRGKKKGWAKKGGPSAGS